MLVLDKLHIVHGRVRCFDCNLVINTNQIIDHEKNKHGSIRL